MKKFGNSQRNRQRKNAWAPEKEREKEKIRINWIDSHTNAFDVCWRMRWFRKAKVQQQKKCSNQEKRIDSNVNLFLSPLNFPVFRPMTLSITARSQAQLLTAFDTLSHSPTRWNAQTKTAYFISHATGEWIRFRKQNEIAIRTAISKRATTSSRKND